MKFIYLLSAKLIMLLLLVASYVDSFPPAKLISNGLNSLSGCLKHDMDEVSGTYSHEDILQRGLVRSVAKYFAQKAGPHNEVNLSKAISGEYLDLRQLYYDYKHEWYQYQHE